MYIMLNNIFIKLEMYKAVCQNQLNLLTTLVEPANFFKLTLLTRMVRKFRLH